MPKPNVCLHFVEREQQEGEGKWVIIMERKKERFIEE
jgi:hypothetical protein